MPAVRSSCPTAALQERQIGDAQVVNSKLANIAAPINLAAALNVLSDSSLAVANAQQVAPITQTT